ncbi:hypothetical protein Ccrd_005446 [Cynara cardunculus var. scolymus]|uniref:Uncharacterized protein n=1 Tax=Cynara cardunculus var. scolymus TaxID=59895 RepID=A0A118JUG9_CYNCS|nr:hypothetical protein Ccrd_005446 [Cynara cardunculus var. scolymus]
MANLYDASAICSSYSPPPEPSDDISLLLRQILFKSSSSSSSPSPSLIPKQVQCEIQRQPPPPHSSIPTYSSAAAANVPANGVAHVSSSSAGTIDYDPDEYDCESEEGFENLMEEMAAKRNPPRNPSKRTRAAEVHNLSEKMLTMRNGINLYSMSAPSGVHEQDQRTGGLNQGNPPANMTVNQERLMNPMLSLPVPCTGQNQPLVLDFSHSVNHEPTFGTQRGSS